MTIISLTTAACNPAGPPLDARPYPLLRADPTGAATRARKTDGNPASPMTEPESRAAASGPM
jgi:hypothetical protein